MDKHKSKEEIKNIYNYIINKKKMKNFVKKLVSDQQYTPSVIPSIIVTLQ